MIYKYTIFHKQICGYSIELFSYDDNVNNFDEIETEIQKQIVSSNNLEGYITVDNVKIYWCCVVFVVSSDWCDEYENTHQINGVFKDELSAKQCFYDVIEKDYKNNETHHKALNEHRDDYYISDSDVCYEIYPNQRYSEWHFCAKIEKMKILTY